MSKTGVTQRTRYFWLIVGLFLSAGALSAETAISTENHSATDPKVLYRNYSCQSCHGERGLNPLPGMPKLGGQDKTYLINQLKDYKSGARVNGRSQTMIGYLATITDEEITIMATWLSEQNCR